MGELIQMELSPAEARMIKNYRELKHNKKISIVVGFEKITIKKTKLKPQGNGKSIALIIYDEGGFSGQK